jgi:hypothetical protein
VSDPEAAQAELPAGYLDLYKLAVEMADRISARRGVANTFFLTVNTGLAALLGGDELRWYVAGAGIVLCAAWWALLKSYRDLNRAKFDVILVMEQRLPVHPFGDEWNELRKSRYRELGRVERIVPALFALVYVAEIIRQAIG